MQGGREGEKRSTSPPFCERGNDEGKPREGAAIQRNDRKEKKKGQSCSGRIKE